MSSLDRPPAATAPAPVCASPVRNLIGRFFVAGVTALLVACGGGSGPGPAPAPATSASAVIGAAGGTLTGPDGVQVVIPPGALSADTTIGIARSLAGAPVALADTPIAGSPYEFTPHDLVFNLPVTIRMPLPSGADGSALFMASPGEDWQAIDATVSAGVAEWTRNSFSFGYAGLPCIATATLADLYPCTYPSGGANAAATPASALTRTAFGSLGLYSGNAGSWNVTQAATVDLTLNYRAAADCTNARVKLIRWNPAVPVTPANPASIVFEQPVALTPTVFSLPGGTFACTGTTNLDGTPCGSYRRAVGSTTVSVPFSHLDSAINATGSHAFGYSFSCNRPGKPRHSGGDLMTFKVSIPVPTVSFSVGGAVSGLTGSGLVLANPGSSNLPIATDGSFTFAPTVGAGSAYAVSVLTQPAGQTCTVVNGSGTANANVTNVAVSCVPSFTISGNVSGLAGTGLVLQNNGGGNLPFATSGAFSFATRLLTGAAYNVTVLTQPSGSTCSVANGTGTVTNANITNVAVTCTSSGPLVLVANSAVRNGTNALSVYRANPSTGVLSFLSNVNAGDTPWAFAQLPNHSVAYVTNAIGGTVQAFGVNNTTGAVTLIPLSSPQSNNSYGVAMDRLGRFLWTANYGFHTVQTFAINGGGVLTSSPPMSTQNGLPYAIAAHPTMDFVYTAHQSNFALTAFSVNTTTGALTQIQSLTNVVTSANALAIDPSGRFAYVVSGGGGICAFGINATTGVLSSVGCANTASSGGTWSVAVHPGGQFLYTTSDTTSNNVSIFSINQTTGALTLSGSPATAGSNPRGITIAPSGNYLYVTNYVSNNVSAFSIGGSGSTLTSLGAAIPTGSNPVGVVVIP
jgi:6-phosphogluconolactonase (cycloisomerase 2 family)